MATFVHVIFENPPNPVMLVFIRLLSVSSLGWVPMCHFSVVFFHSFVLAKLATNSIRVKMKCECMWNFIDGDILYWSETWRHVRDLAFLHVSAIDVNKSSLSENGIVHCIYSQPLVPFHTWILETALIFHSVRQSDNVIYYRLRWTLVHKQLCKRKSTCFYSVWIRFDIKSFDS